MGDTTLTLSEETREKLREHRGGEHEAVGDVLEGMMTILPAVEEIREGCDNAECDGPHIYDGTPEDTGGVIRWFHAENIPGGDEVYGSSYYCSVECAMEVAERQQEQFPTDPDQILVGGKSELQAAFEGASLYIDYDTKEVGIPIPGAFSGTDSHGGEYDFIGEPVYVENAGSIVQKGVIDEIIHEESHTTLILGRDLETEMLNHPNPGKREEYEEQHQKQTTNECAACGTEFQHPVKDAPEECPSCGSEEW